MVNFTERSYKKELLDRNDIPFPDIKLNMQELEIINHRLGGHRITLKGFVELLNGKKAISVCEIGCGGGDNLKAIHKWCKKHQISVHCIGIDIKNECINYARENCALIDSAEWICSDYVQVEFVDKPDIIFSSLFCHHLTEDEIATNLVWMDKQSKLGFFVNDLHRHPLAYYSIKWLTGIFSKSYLVKNDAPVSVTRGFKKSDWEQLFKSSFHHMPLIKWEWAFRWLIIHKKMRANID